MGFIIMAVFLWLVSGGLALGAPFIGIAVAGGSGTQCITAQGCDVAVSLLTMFTLWGVSAIISIVAFILLILGLIALGKKGGRGR